MRGFRPRKAPLVYFLDLVLRRREERSLNNNSFLGEYECSSLALDREEMRDDKNSAVFIDRISNGRLQAVSTVPDISGGGLVDFAPVFVFLWGMLYLEDGSRVMVVKVVHELDYKMVVKEIEGGLLEEIESPYYNNTHKVISAGHSSHVADSMLPYFSSSEARSWSIPSEDPYEEAARQLLEQAPRSPEYVPDPIELEDHVPVLLLTTPRPSCEVGESSAAAAARQPGPTMAHRVDYSLVAYGGPAVESFLGEIEVIVESRDLLRAREYGGPVRPWLAYHAFQALEAGARVDTLEDTVAVLDLVMMIAYYAVC
ncbi:hypothetical protein Tco_0291950 [Tanacetum coccineum]